MFSQHGLRGPITEPLPVLPAAPQGPAGPTPRALRVEADELVARLERLCRPGRRRRPSVGDLDDVTRALQVLQGRIRACEPVRDPEALFEVLHARRCVDRSLVLTLTTLVTLRGA